MNRSLANAAFVLLLWLPVLGIMELEWRYNEQYHYGYFVPLFSAYLVYLRWSTRPTPADPALPIWVLFVSVACFIPLQVVQTANPDWRLIYWMSTLLAILATLALLDRIGGLQWMRHFLPALAMMLFGVPWLTGIENTITYGLMDWVTSITVEVMNLSGIYAVQIGNVIRLPGAVVGVEEACSGVRSLQSSLMAGYLFGELFRFRWSMRLFLILFGVVVTFILNLIRTLLLSIVTMELGVEGFDRWHDTIGNIILITGFATLALTAWLLQRLTSRSSAIEEESGADSLPPSPVRSLPLRSVGALALIIGVSIVFDYVWFMGAGTSRASFDYANIQWENVATDTTSMEFDPVTVAQLKFSHGQHVTWTGERGVNWTAFYFNWMRGNISSHAGVHRPENCLPAVGLSMIENHGIRVWTTPEGYQIPFRAMTFEGYGHRSYVFFAVWDEGGHEPWISVSWRERLLDAWQRRLVHGRHSMQLIAEQAPNFATAEAQWHSILAHMYATGTHNTSEQTLTE